MKIDKKRKEFEKWANSEMKKIQKMLLTEDFELQPIEQAKNPDTSTCAYSYPYKEIDIRYSESIFDFWKDGDRRSAWSVLLHEMIHPITDKLYGVGYDRFASKSQIENEREQLTDHFTNVIIKLTYDRDNKRT